MKYFLLSFTLLLASCTGTPENIKPVQGFEVNRYLGTWYEIARLDHRFERGLSHVTAEYSLREDGGVTVVNRGYSRDEKAWDVADGKAYFVGEPDSGHLKVSFWGPFYSSYVIFELDKAHYQYALVSGADKDYFWILARTPQVDPALMEQLIGKATSLGFATDKLIKVDQLNTPE